MIKLIEKEIIHLTMFIKMVENFHIYIPLMIGFMIKENGI